MDNQRIHALDGELTKFKSDLRYIEKVMVDLSELERKINSIEERFETKHNEHAKKNQTLVDKLKVCDGSIRALDSDVAIMTTEAKSVQRLVNESREAQKVIFAKAVADFEARSAQISQQ
jgi:chromosome segregation ATPase